MAYRFDADEIVEMAREIERIGATFYAEALEQAESVAVREVFALLWEEEQAHAEAFGRLREALGEGDEAVQMDPEHAEYVRDLYRSRVFPDPEAVREYFSEIRDEASAIRLALRFERDTVLLFHEMKGSVTDKAKALLDEMINEERQHVRRLNELFRDRVVRPAIER
jgi:rubrerythrin